MSPRVSGRFGELAGAIAFAWMIVTLAFGLYNLPLVVVVKGEQGGYCEVDDHPGPCPSLGPWFAHSLTAVAGGWWALTACNGLRKERPGARRQLIVALSTSAVVLFALAVWAVLEDTGDRLSTPGGFLMAFTLADVGACVLVTALLTRGSKRSL